MKPIALRWLAGRTHKGAVSWGMPWPKGVVKPGTAFTLKNENGGHFVVQTRCRAYWPDGSVKWTLHSAIASGEMFFLKEAGMERVMPRECRDDKIRFGEMELDFSEKTGVPRIRYGRETRGGRLIARISGEEYVGYQESIEIEDMGAVRMVIKITGAHLGPNGQRVLPFILRYYVYQGDPQIRLVHTWLHDLDPFTQQVDALGIEFRTPIQGPIYNRHVRIAGDTGYLKESCVLLNSWRPRLPREWYSAQIAGEMLSLNPDQHPEAFQAMNNMTWWDSWKIVQDSSEHYRIQKGTGEKDCSFVDGPEGRRSGGYLYAAGLGVGLKDFWQKYPSILETEGMLGEEAVLRVWIWPPEGRPMDLRPYTHRPCSQGYYGQGDTSRSRPSGIGMTNEIGITLWGQGTPTDEELEEARLRIQKPALLVADPAYYHEVRAFGTWSLPAYDTPAKRYLEQVLADTFSFYQREVEQRKWYGLWNYGDFMHTYDMERHSWRYDMGGWAWQNTELVPTLWLWYMFLRTGREDVFTMAEAMCRHTSEVDIHHIGPFAGLGSRHNVKHWGGSAKEARISMAPHHRFYYYLTGDERVGDIMDEVKDADLTTKHADPLRNYYHLDGSEPYSTHARTGPDWSSYCGNWMTRWERFQDTFYRDKMRRGIEGIAAAPYRFLSGTDFGYDPDTGRMYYIGEQSTGGSHLALCMGEPQVYFELEDMLEDPLWHDMLVQYGAFYFLSPEEKERCSNSQVAGKGWGLPMCASAMVAYAAHALEDERLGREVWDCLFTELYKTPEPQREVEYVTGIIQEKPGISTNTCAQWCLNVITSLELVGKYLPSEPLQVPVDKFLHWKG